jgi:hypothetical protein
MPERVESHRRPRGAGSIQWKRSRPYAVYRDVLTGKQTWTGFDTAEGADAFLAQCAADKKAARVAAKAAPAEREARARQRRPPSSGDPWTFGQVLTDWEDRHRDGVQESTMRDYGPALNDLRRALGGVFARSLTDEHFETYKRAKLDGIDVAGGEEPVQQLSAATVNKRLDLARRIIREAIRRGVMAGPNPVDEVVRPRDPKREQMVFTEPEMRRLTEMAGTLELRALLLRARAAVQRGDRASHRGVRRQAADRANPPAGRRAARAEASAYGHQGLREDAVGHPHAARIRGAGGGTGRHRRLPQLGYQNPAWATRVTMAVDDLTGDGRPEVVIADQGPRVVMVYCNASAPAGGCRRPAARDDVAVVAENAGATAIDVLANDTDPDGEAMLVVSVTQPAHGSVAIAAGGVTYRPNVDYCNDLGGAPDIFTYTLNGGSTATVAVTVECVDDVPPVTDVGTLPAPGVPAPTPPPPTVPRTCSNPGTTTTLGARTATTRSHRAQARTRCRPAAATTRSPPATGPGTRSTAARAATRSPPTAPTRSRAARP